MTESDIRDALTDNVESELRRCSQDGFASKTAETYLTAATRLAPLGNARATCRAS